MSLRGEAHRSAIRAVLAVFGDDAAHFVFVGGCALGLYARPAGPALRVTKDVDCISTLSPWTRQQSVLAGMCSRGVLNPDTELACRYGRAGGARRRVSCSCLMSRSLGPVCRQKRRDQEPQKHRSPGTAGVPRLRSVTGRDGWLRE